MSTTYGWFDVFYLTGWLWYCLQSMHTKYFKSKSGHELNPIQGLTYQNEEGSGPKSHHSLYQSTNNWNGPKGLVCKLGISTKPKSEP